MTVTLYYDPMTDSILLTYCMDRDQTYRGYLIFLSEISGKYISEDAYSSGHLVLSHLGLAFVLMLIPFFPELVMSMDLLSFEHSSVLLFCSTHTKIQAHLIFLLIICKNGKFTTPNSGYGSFSTRDIS